MLKLLRNQKFKKRIFYMLAIIIVPSFIFWGSASVIRDKKSKGRAGYAGKIFGKRISFEEYMSALHAWRNELSMKFGTRANQVETLLDSNEAVWDKLILLHEANKLRIKVTNDELTSYITSFPFLERDGLFNSELYELFLKYSLGTPARVFEEQIRDSLKIQRLFDFLTDDVDITKTEVRTRYNQEREQIKVKYIDILSADLESEITLSEQDSIDYYEKQKDNFRIPIQINLSYIGIDYPDQAAEEQKQSVNEEIKQIHEAVKESNKLLTAEEKFQTQIKETGLFTLDESMPGHKLTPNDLIELFNLKEDQISNIIQTSHGPYIFQLKAKLINDLPEFEKVKDKVKDKLIQVKSKELAKARMDDYRSRIELEKGSNPNLNLQQATKKLGLSIKETEFFTRFTPPEELGTSKEVGEIAFSLAENEISQTIEFDQGCCVIEKSQLQPIDEEKYQEEKDNFKKALLEEKKNKIFEEYFSKIKAKANLTDYISFQQAQQPPAGTN